MTGRLVVRRQAQPGRVYLLEEARFVLGRDATNDVVVDDPFVSRRHAEIAWDGEAYVLHDLGSRNGTRVNGSRVFEPARLKHGDVIALGDVTLVFQMTDETLLRGGEPSGALRVDVDSAEAWVGERRLELTAKEFRALTFLYQRAGAVCSKEDLAAHVWPEYGGTVADYNIEQLISRLRRKLGEDPGGSRRLLTVRGLGYRLVVD